MYSYSDNDSKPAVLQSSRQLREYCANCFYFKTGAVSELSDKNGLYSRILGRAGHYCDKENPSVKKLLRCNYFEPWDKRAFRKYEEISDLINSQEHDSIYKQRLEEQKHELTDYLKAVNATLFMELSEKKPVCPA